MGRTLLLAVAVAVALAAVLLSPIASAQTAFRCDVSGTTVYSDKPCPPGSTAKAVTATQDTAEQKAASTSANAQMRNDNAELNKRLTEREKLDAKERADARKAASKLRADGAKEKVEKSRKASKGSKGSKTVKAKAPKKSAAKKTSSSGRPVTAKP